MPLGKVEFIVGAEAGAIAGAGGAWNADCACNAATPEVGGTGDALDAVGDAAWGVPLLDDVAAAEVACVEVFAVVADVVAGAAAIGAGAVAVAVGAALAVGMGAVAVAAGAAAIVVGVADVLVDLPGATAVGARDDFVDGAAALADEVEGADVLAEAPAGAGRGAVDAPNDAPGALNVAEVAAAAVDAPNDAFAVDVLNDAPVVAGAALARTALMAPAAAVFPVGGVPVGEAPLGVTPTGLETFLAASPEASEVDVPRGAALAAPGGLEELAPIETPTGREALTWVVPDGEDAIPGF